MAISITYKIRLGTLFLLLLLVISSGIGIFYQVNLGNASKNILKDNYESLDYCHGMQRELDSIHISSTIAVQGFENNLLREEKNITEPGEKEAAQSIRNSFTGIKKGTAQPDDYVNIKANLQKILQLNMQAIERKNTLSNLSAEKAYTGIILVASLTLIIGLTFAFNFPGVVVEPIKKLMVAIKEISGKNYQYRIHLDNTDEFGQLADAFNTMSERLEGFESSNLNKLIFEKTRAESVINSLKDASIGIDDQKILFANQQAMQLLGLKKEETIGKHIRKISEQNDLFKFLMENETNAPFKIVMDGKENFYIREVIEVQQENAASKVIVLKNITSFKEMDVAKNNFIATISHELKTPLASSDFSLKLLEDNRVSHLTNEQKELVEQLKNDNQRMLRILSELLNMSQVESGKIRLDIQKADPHAIVAGSVKAVAVTARQKQIAIECQLEENLPPVNVDADKISWVLNNFFTNAVKFSPEESSVILYVSNKDSFVYFSVADKGPGIEEKYLGKIFDRYFQVPGRSDTTGSGIGLAICKEFVEAMGGAVSVKSETGKGSVFGFRVPVAVG